MLFRSQRHRGHGARILLRSERDVPDPGLSRPYSSAIRVSSNGIDRVGLELVRLSERRSGGPMTGAWATETRAGSRPGARRKAADDHSASTDAPLHAAQHLRACFQFLRSTDRALPATTWPSPCPPKISASPTFHFSEYYAIIPLSREAERIMEQTPEPLPAAQHPHQGRAQEAHFRALARRLAL